MLFTTSTHPKGTLAVSIPQSPLGQVKRAQEQTPNQPAHFATLQRAARDTQVRAALAGLIEFVTPTNAWRAFTATELGYALTLTPGTINRHLRTLIRRGYLEERATHRRAGEREARLTTTHGAPGAQAR